MKPENIENYLMHVEDLMTKYEVLAGEDLRATIIIDFCTRYLEEHLELGTREMKYKEICVDIMSKVE